MAKTEQTENRALESRRALLIGLALLLSYAYFFYLGGNWNVESRNAQIFALAERGSLVIDGYPFLPPGGGDAARYQDHYYSDKLIGPSLVAVPFYWAARHTLTAVGVDFFLSVYLALRLTNLLTNALPSALLGALLYLFLATLVLSPQVRAWLVFTYGLGTLAFPYSTALFGHQFAAVCVAGAFMLLWRQREAWSSRRALAAGAFAGLAAISDVMGVFVGALLGAYAVSLAVAIPASGRQDNLAPPPPLRARRGGTEVKREDLGQAGVRFARFAAFVLPVLAVFSIQLLANWSSFGNPLTFPHIYHAQAAFRARHTSGLFGLHTPQLYPLYQLTLGPWRGLFHGSPVLLLALPGLSLLGRKRRAEAVTIAACYLAVLLIHSGYENWTTGSAYGPRYQIVTLPLLIIALAPAAERWPFIFRPLALVSIASMAIVTATTPFIPEGLRSPLPNALQQFAQGNLLMGNLGMLTDLRGLASLLPLALGEIALLYRLRRTQPAAVRTKPPSTSPR